MFYTKRLMLRNIDPEADSKVILQWLNSVDFVHALTLDAPLPSSRDKAKKFIEKMADKEDKLPLFIICERPEDGDEPATQEVDDDYFVKDGKSRYPCIGMLHVGFDPGYSSFNRVAAFGIFLDKGHRNGGLGTEVLEWAVEYCFRDLGVRRLELGLDAQNLRALHVYEKVGFVREGLRRKRFLRDGEWHDQIDMGLLAEEWRGGRW